MIFQLITVALIYLGKQVSTEHIKRPKWRVWNGGDAFWQNEMGQKQK